MKVGPVDHGRIDDQRDVGRGRVQQQVGPVPIGVGLAVDESHPTFKNRPTCGFDFVVPPDANRWSGDRYRLNRCDDERGADDRQADPRRRTPVSDSWHQVYGRHGAWLWLERHD